MPKQSLQIAALWPTGLLDAATGQDIAPDCSKRLWRYASVDEQLFRDYGIITPAMRHEMWVLWLIFAAVNCGLWWLVLRLTGVL
jgi:hypothetical protein